MSPRLFVTIIFKHSFTSVKSMCWLFLTQKIETSGQIPFQICCNMRLKDYNYVLHGFQSLLPISTQRVQFQHINHYQTYQYQLFSQQDLTRPCLESYGPDVVFFTHAPIHSQQGCPEISKQIGPLTRQMFLENTILASPSHM